MRRISTKLTRLMSRSLLRTSLYDTHVALGAARIVPFAGWEMPVQYAGIVDQARRRPGPPPACSTSRTWASSRCAGEYALQVVNYLVTNDVAKLEDGQALYTCCCNAKRDDPRRPHRLPRRARPPPHRLQRRLKTGRRSRKVFAGAAETHCQFEDRSDETALIAFQGPKAFDVLDLAGSDAATLRQLGPFHFRDAVVANVQCTVARTGYTGEDGVEIFCAWKDRPALWRALLELGKPFGVKPIGLGARDTLRLEARLSLYGNDIDETTNPLEAGLGWVVEVVEGDFVGRAALGGDPCETGAPELVGFEVTGARDRPARLRLARPERSGARGGYLCTSWEPKGRPLAETSASAICLLR